MSDNHTSKTSWFVPGIVGLLIGLIIGLPILGWMLWPVQWTGGNMEILPPDLQQDYLRASIDSYSVSASAEIATLRYYNLGRFKESTLSTIYASPGTQSPEAISNFAAAVGAQDVLTNPPRQPVPMQARATLAMWVTALCGLLLVAALVIAILVFWLRSRKSRKAAPQSGAVEPIPPAAPAEAAPAPEAEEVAPEEIPDWLQEETGADYAQNAPTVRTSTAEAGGLGEALAPAVAIGAAAVAASALKDDQPAETVPVAAAESEQPAAETEPPAAEAADEDDLSWLDLAAPAAGAAVVAGAVALAASDEQETTETAGAAPEEAAFAGESAQGEIAEPETVDLQTGAAEAAAPVALSAAAAAALAAAADTDLPDEPGEDESPEETYRKFGREIEFIEGIGPVYGERLRSVGITAPLLLLRNGATPKDRREIAEKTGISEKLILRWINHVDLFRVKGISQGYAELLEAAGVDTVVELARRNPANLHESLLETNEQRNLVRKPPALSSVENWVEQAKQLPRAISY